MGVEDTSWASMKKFLSQRGVIQGILAFDARNVSKGARDKVNKLIQSKPMSFDAVAIQNVSRATAPLAAWVKANVRYSEVLLKIEPLTNELGGLERQLGKSQKRVHECEQQLQELDASVSVLNDNFAGKTAEAESLKIDLKKAEDTLHAAQSLLQQLSGENERWRTQVHTLEQEMALVPARSMISAAVMTYLGGENETTREKMTKEWA
jgi:dynein heavy chain 2